MNFYWRRVESQEKLQRRGNSVHNITLVGFRGQKVAHHVWRSYKEGSSVLEHVVAHFGYLQVDRNLRGYHRRPSLLDEIRTKSPGDFGSWSSGSILCLVSQHPVPSGL